jgi:hypothetical protein
MNSKATSSNHTHHSALAAAQECKAGSVRASSNHHISRATASVVISANPAVW